jgi:hypothetical protein
MARRFNPPPNWPPPPEGWTPPPGWQPDASWGPPPKGWELWVKDGNWFARHKILMGIFGLVAALLAIAVMTGDSGGGKTETTSQGPGTTAPSPAATQPTDAGTSKAREPSNPPKFDPRTYSALSSRTFQKLMKDPDAFKGNKVVLYGEVTQFDAATGEAVFLANSGHKKDLARDGYTTYEHNTMYEGDASRLRDVVEKDLFKAYVEVLGSESYDTQIGGNTTVPKFRIERIAVYGSVE